MSDFYLSADQSDTNRENVIQNIRRAIRGLDKDKKWKVSVKLHTKKRTLEQNAYYWSVVLVTIKNWHHESTGIMASEKAIHNEIKEVYVPYSIETNLSGEEEKIYKSTTKMNTTEFNLMFDQIITDFAEKGCHVPLPDKSWRSNKRKAA